MRDGTDAMQPQSKEHWYQEGLQFSCTQCGNCCTGEPGYVWVEDEQIAEIAEGLGESAAEVERKYVKRVGRHRSLKEKEDGACVFYEADVGCTIYRHRPVQCRTWPFWPSNLQSRAAWKEVAKSCPGCDQGRLYTLEQINACAEVIDL